jgi:hypothetical protein
MATTTTTTSSIGLSLFKGDWDGAEWTICGYPKRGLIPKEFDSAYDFEEFIQTKVNCKGISFDSESCEFFAYAKTKARAEKFLKDVEKYFQTVRDKIAELL